MVGLIALIGLFIVLDLGIFHRKSRVVSLAEALGWSAVWVSFAVAFNVGVFYLYELNPSGWDMDAEQHRVLFWGIFASTKAGRDTIALLSPLADEMEALAIASYQQARRA